MELVKKRLRADLQTKDLFNLFMDETYEQYNERLILILEILNNSETLFSSTKTKEILNLLKKLFDIIDRFYNFIIILIKF